MRAAGIDRLMRAGNPTTELRIGLDSRVATQRSTSRDIGYFLGEGGQSAAEAQFRRRPRLRGGEGMGIGASIFLFAIGAVLTWAVNVTTSGVDLHAIGVILMIVGAIGLLVSLFVWG